MKNSLPAHTRLRPKCTAFGSGALLLALAAAACGKSEPAGAPANAPKGAQGALGAGEQALQEGLAFAAKQDFDNAVAAFERAVRLEPKNPRYLHELGLAETHAKDFGQAEQEFTRGIDADPSFFKNWYDRGIVRMLMGRLDEAQADLEKSAQMAPDQALVFHNLGCLYMQRSIVVLGAQAQDEQMLGKARTSFERALQLDPRLFPAQFQLGMALARLKQEEPAKAALRKAIALDPKQPAALLELGKLCSRSGGTEEARKVLRAACEIAGAEQGESFYELGLLESEEGQDKRALELLQQASALEPWRSATWSELAKVHARLGDDAASEAARARHEKALADDAVIANLRANAQNVRDNAGPYVKLGEALFAARRLDEALRAYTAAQAINPSLPLVQRELGRVQLAQGRPKEARGALETANVLQPGQAQTLALLGNACLGLSDLPAAQKALQEALAVQPDLPDALSDLAVVHLRQGHLPEAEGTLLRALEKNPRDARSLYNLAGVRLQQGQRSAALELYRRVLELNPKHSGAKSRIAELSQAESRPAVPR